MTNISVSASSHQTLIYQIDEAHSEADFFLHNTELCSFAIYYSMDPQERNFKAMEPVWPEMQRCGLPSIDYFKFRFIRPGIYHVKIGNEGAWIMSVNVRIHLRFRKSNGDKMNPVEIHKPIKESSSWW